MSIVSFPDQARAIPLNVVATADSAYAIGFGDATGIDASTFAPGIAKGGALIWQQVESYPGDSEDHNYVYFVTGADDSTAQGTIASFSDANRNLVPPSGE